MTAPPSSDLPPNRTTTGLETVTHPTSLGTIGAAVIAGAAFLGQAQPHDRLTWALACFGALAAVMAVITPKASTKP